MLRLFNLSVIRLVKIITLLFFLNSSLLIINSFGQEWNLQAELDSAEVHKKRTMQKFVDEFDKFLINDFLREGLKLNKLISTAPFLQYPALNPDLGAYLADFENETGTTVIIRAYIDITYFNPWVVALRASQKAQKAFEINRANPAYTIIDIAYSPTGMKNKYDVAGYNIIVRDSLRTSAFKERFSDEDFARMRDTIQAAMGNTVATVDTLGFNSAIIRGLEALKGDLKMKPDPGYKVTFRKGDAAGYDTYKYPALNSNYQRDAVGNPIPWLAIDAKQTQTLRGKYYAADTEAAKETPLKINAEDLAAGSLTMEGDSIIKQTLTPAGRAREMTVEANYSRLNKFGKEQETVAGQIAVAAYEPLVMNVVIVHQPNNKPDFKEVELQNYLNDIYKQAITTWNVEFQSFNYNFPNEIQIGNALLSSYSSQMNDIIKAFKKAEKIDSKTYYVFMVSSISDGVSGYMPMKGQFGFVKTTGDTKHTIAHELGHGAFRLWHTFSEKNMIAAQGMTDNLMDYNNGTRLYKHQWDLVHNPETLLFPFLIEEEEELKSDIKEIMATKLVGLTLAKYPDGTFYVKGNPIVHVMVNPSTGKPYCIDKKWAVTVTYFQYEEKNQIYTVVLKEPYEGHIYGLKPSAFYNYNDTESLKQKENDDNIWKKEAEDKRIFDPIFMLLQEDSYIRQRDELAPERYNKTSDYYNKLEAITYLVGEVGFLKDFLVGGKFFKTNYTTLFSKLFGFSEKLGVKLYKVDPAFKVADEASGILQNGIYKKNPTSTKVENLTINPSGTIRGKSRLDPTSNTTNLLNGTGYMYVIDESGSLIIGTRTRGFEFSTPPGKAPHPTLIGGADPKVQAAGTIEFRGGKIYKVDNASGHYKPADESLKKVEEIFRRYFPSNSFDKDFKGFIPYGD